ncbi:MAG: hypothetical protein RL385_4782, partial [Pseudomonadota bacterium]
MHRARLHRAALVSILSGRRAERRAAVNSCVSQPLVGANSMRLLLTPTSLACVLLVPGCSLSTSTDYTFRDLSYADAGEHDGGDEDAGDGEDAALNDAGVDDAATDGSAIGEDTGPGPGPVCSMREQICNDGFDDDCDKQADCDDEDCRGAASCCTPSTQHEQACGNMTDDDCDGQVDCADPECRQAPACCKNPAPELGDMACTDGKDNDCDGVLDCAEPSCKGIYLCTCTPTGGESHHDAPASCVDQSDNDCDGLLDCKDKECGTSPACCTPTAGQEARETSCSDGVNNDCDDAGPDCADPDCREYCACPSSVPENCPTPGSCPVCGDGIDNDCNGYKDCDVEACKPSRECCKASPAGATSET